MRVLFDLETNNLLPDVNVIHCVAACDIDTGEEFFFGPTEIPEAIKFLKRATLLAGHNVAGYDVPVLDHVLGVDLRHIPVLDTMAISRAMFYSTLRDADYKRISTGFPKALVGRFSLESWGWRLGTHKGEFGCGGKTDWSTYTDEMGEYCRTDVRVNVKLLKFLQEFERVPGHPAVPLEAMLVESRIHGILGEQERAGVAFDVEGAVALAAELQTDKAKMVAELQEIYPARWVNLGEFTPKRDNKTMGYIKGMTMTKVELQEFNPGSDQQVGARLVEQGWKPVDFTPGGQPKVSEEVLSTLREEDYPGVSSLLKFAVVNKRLGQIIDGKAAWLKKVEDGRLHGRVMATGTRTGRMSHSSPNLAQVPRVGSFKGSECRALFGPQATGYLVGCDASGLELRTLANRMATFDGGRFAKEVVDGDIHETMRIASGLNSRNHQKTFTYAMLYGAGATKLGTTVAADLRDAGLPVNQSDSKLGKQTHARLVKSLKGLGPLLKAAKDAHSRGFIRLLDGRYVQSASDHSALNTLLQGDGSVVMKQAQFILDGWLRQGDLNYSWNLTIHDEFQIETDTLKGANAIGVLAAESIRLAGRQLNMKVALDAEYKVGRNWEETH